MTVLAGVAGPTASDSLNASPDTVAVVDGLAFAPFGRRVAALALDAALLALTLVLLVEVLRGMAGPTWSPFVAFWRTADVVAVESDLHRSDSVTLHSGAVRDMDQRWEVRRYADGTTRIFGIADSRITAPDGTVEEFHLESEVGRDVRTVARRWLTWALFSMVPFAYFAVFEGSPWQASPGKIALDLQVVDRHGHRIGVARTIARQVLKLVELASTGLGYALAAMTGRRQAFHDVIVGTYVIVGSKRG